jgi:ketosteroid isomerase-like protein
MPLARPPYLRLGIALLGLACARPPRSPAPLSLSPQAAVDELLAADRAYSAASARTDVVTGLTAMFADDVVMPVPGGGFAEGAAKAADALRATSDNARSRIEWVPVRGGIAADGQHGFTFGYMTLHRPDSTRVPLKYLAYWVRRPEGWRVAVYKRGRRPEGEVSLALRPPALPPRMVRPLGDAETARFRESLDRAERDFSQRAQVVGLGPAFTEYGSADAVNMGGPNDTAFVVGAEAIGRVVSAGGPPTGSPVSWAPDRVIVASSGDLGVTIGMIRPNAPAANGAPAAGIPFFTIWRRATARDPWRYVAE